MVPLRVKDQHNKRTLWGFEINPSSNWRRQSQKVPARTFNAGWTVADPAAPFHRVVSNMLGLRLTEPKPWCFPH